MPKPINWSRAKRLRRDGTTAKQHRLYRQANKILREAPRDRALEAENATLRARVAHLTAATQDQRPKRHKRRHGTRAAAKFHWPVYITIGPHPLIPGALDCVELSSRVEADRCGYSWAGR